MSFEPNTVHAFASSNHCLTVLLIFPPKLYPAWFASVPLALTASQNYGVVLIFLQQRRPHKPSADPQASMSRGGSLGSVFCIILRYVCGPSKKKVMFSSLFQRKCLQSRPRCYACLVNKPYLGVYRIRLHTPRCHGLRLYPVCVCNTVRLGQYTT